MKTESLFPEYADCKEIESGAVISPCEQYRYQLHRIWNRELPLIMWIMLNPSTADASKDDATIRRLTGFTKDWGYGGFYVCNLFAFRATKPTDIPRTPSLAIGDENNDYIQSTSRKCEKIILAWGGHGNRFNRDKEVIKIVTEWEKKDIYCLGLTNDNSPKHPLYLPKNLTPIPFEP